MSKLARLSDGELVERLRLAEKHGAKAARILGIQPSAFRQSISTAKARGLTPSSKLANEEDKLRTKLKLIEAELAAVHRENVTAEVIREQIYALAAETPDAPKWIAAKKSKGKTSTGIPIAIWSDWHWGERVFVNEVAGANTFNRAIAKERVKRLVQQTTDLAMNHMSHAKYPGIVVCLGGDMVSGNIHEELRETNDGSLQQTLLEVQEQLIMALTQMADTFGKVFVPCVVGNHGRMTHKPRAKNRVFENYEWNLYCQLERHFRNDKRLQFMIPGETDAYFSVLGHRFLLTHGDCLGVKGGDGIIGAIGPIARGAVKIGRSEAQVGRHFDTLLMGHWHTYIPRGDASPVLVNGSLKGFDEYARLFLRVPYSRPSQSLLFVHESHGITAQWQVYLDQRRNSMARAPWVSWQDQRIAA